MIELDAHATRRTGSQAVRAGMEKGRYAQLLNFLHQWIKLRVIRVKGLHTGMKLRARQPHFLDSALHFFHGRLPFMWVNAGEPDKLLRIAFDDFRDIIVAQRW